MSGFGRIVILGKFVIENYLEWLFGITHSSEIKQVKRWELLDGVVVYKVLL